MIPETDDHRAAHPLLFPALLCAIGIAAWVVLWFAAEPHASWDALFYHRFAAGYAGFSETQQDSYAWTTFASHADPDYREWLIEHRSWPWGGWDDPMRERWIGVYQMRPLYPLLVAAGIPILGTQAPMAVTALVTVGFVLVLGLGIARIAGRAPAIVVIALCLATPAFSMWLVFLQTDGIGIVLFAAALVLLALYLSEGRATWIVGFGISVGLLAIARPLAYALSAAIAVSLAIAAVRRDAVMRRLGVALAVAGVPLTAFLAFSVWADYPSFVDMLQDLPTRHFSQPDVQDPLRFLAGTMLRQLRVDLLPSLVANPLLCATLVVAAIGYWRARPGWWAVPILASVPFIAMIYAVHPSITEIVRTLAPAWIAVHLGVALFLGRAWMVAAALGGRALANRPW